MLAAEGAKVAVVDMDTGRGEKVAAAIAGRRRGGGVRRRCRVRGTTSRRWSRRSSRKWGRIDILVNNAAISDNKTILDITKEQWDAVIAVTLTGPFLMSQHVARRMVAQGTRRQDRQCRLDLGLLRPLARHRLCGRQGRRRQSHPRHGGAARPAQHPRQRRGAEQDRLAGRQGRVRSDPPGRQPARPARRAARHGARRAVPGVGGLRLHRRQHAVRRRRRQRHDGRRKSRPVDVRGEERRA